MKIITYFCSDTYNNTTERCKVQKIFAEIFPVQQFAKPTYGATCTTSSNLVLSANEKIASNACNLFCFRGSANYLPMPRDKDLESSLRRNTADKQGINERGENFFVPSIRSFHFGQVLPVAAGHHATLLPGVDSLGNRQCTKIILPQQLKLPFVLGKPLIGKFIGDHAAVVLQRHPAGHLAVVVVSEIAAAVVDEPPLVGEAVGEIVEPQRQRVVLGRDGGEIGSVGGFLQPDELFETFAFVGDLERELVKGLDIGIGLIGQHAPALVENTSQTTQQQHIALSLLPVPGVDEHREGTGNQAAFETAPHPVGMRRVGRDLMYPLREERLGFARSDQRVGEGPQRIDIEQGRKKSVEGFIVTKDQHRVRKVSVAPRSYRPSAAGARSADVAPARDGAR